MNRKRINLDQTTKMLFLHSILEVSCKLRLNNIWDCGTAYAIRQDFTWHSFILIVRAEYNITWFLCFELQFAPPGGKRT